MDQLIEGFRRFRSTYYQEHRGTFEMLAERGQSPKAAVITCADSRIDPQLIFGAGPGEIFVVRNVANLVPPYQPSADYHGTSAALEFAVRSLCVKHVIVLGHARCGGVSALLREPENSSGDFIAAWMSIARTARSRALAAAGDSPEDAQRICEHETVKVSLDNLMTFPWVRDPVERGQLSVHGWYYDLERGDLLCLDSTGEFRPV